MRAPGGRATTPARLLLLLSAGGFIGAVFPLGKLAAEAGVSPLAYALVVSLASGTILWTLGRHAPARCSLDRHVLRYFLFAGLLTFALPYVTLILVIGHLGSGLPAILQSLAPVCTVLLTFALGMERPVARRIVGIGLGVAGVQAVIGHAAHGREAAAPLVWYAVALVPPLALAAGNVYRTASWPAGISPLAAAGGCLLGAAAWLAPAAAVQALGDGGTLIAPLLASPAIVAAQIFCTAAGYILFFQLQRVAGPVFLSQISYVNTGVGVAFAVLLLREPLPSAIWLGAALIFAGVYLVNRTQAASHPRARSRRS